MKKWDALILGIDILFIVACAIALAAKPTDPWALWPDIACIVIWSMNLGVDIKGISERKSA